MRDILFRGKRTSDGTWVEGGIWVEDEEVFIIGPIRYFPDTRDWDTYEYYVKNPVYHMGKIRVDPETVGQFTGLLDMNGKKIFEGDIVSVTHLTPNSTWDYTSVTGVVQWTGGAFEAEGVENDDYTPYGWLHDSVARCREIISNVHDNPDLLKGD